MFELYKFRWAHYHTIDKVIDIILLAILCFWIALGISLLIGIDPMINRTILDVTAIVIFNISLCGLFVGYYRQGRFDQKYLNEMNEIRIKLKRKPIKDI